MNKKLEFIVNENKNDIEISSDNAVQTVFSFKCRYAGDGRTICKYILQNKFDNIQCDYLNKHKCTYTTPIITVKNK